MNTRDHASLHLPLLIAGIAAILLGAVATIPLAASIPSAAEGFRNLVTPGDSPGMLLPPVEKAPAKAAPKGRAKTRCEECGVIESTWEVEGGSRESGDSPTRTYETLIRLHDGSMLVINDVNPATRRPGERVNVIRGTD